MMSMELIPRGSDWLLPITGQLVTRCWVDPAYVGLLCQNAIQISIGEPFTLAAPHGGSWSLDPGGDPMGLAPFLRIMRQRVLEGIAFHGGGLALAFDDGTRIEVPAGREFEAWTLAGPGGIDGLKIVSMPGGELAIWPDSRNRDGQRSTGT